MSRIEDLIKKLCPNGVEFKQLKDVAEMRRGTPITRKDVSDGPYPVVAGGKEPAYHCDRYNREGDIITVAGSGANAGFLRYWRRRIFVSDAFSVKAKEGCSTMYLLFVLMHMQLRIHAKKQGAGVPHVHIKDIESFQIPVPPLEIQKEVVLTIEKLKDLEDKLDVTLKTEIDARRRQYEFYRRKLFEPSEQADKQTLGAVCTITTGVQFNKSDMSSEGTFPVFNGGVNASGYTEQYNQDENTITISQGGASAGYVNWQAKKFWAGAHCYVVKPLDSTDNRYLFHFLKENERILKQGQYGAGIPALAKSKIESLEIPIPPLQKQGKIANILDKFSTRIDELSSALQRERELRTRYFWGCRDKLLTFKQSSI